MADLFDGYPLGEVVGRDVRRRRASRGPPTPGCSPSLQPIDGEELAARADVLTQTYRDAGVTFAHAGEEQPFPLDIVPRVIGADGVGTSSSAASPSGCSRWRRSSPTSTAPGQVFTDRVVPRSVITTSAHFHRAGARARAAQRRPRARRRASTWCATRPATSGCWRTTCARRPGSATSSPTGAAMSQVLPELFADHRIQPVDDYPSRLLAALRASAPVERRRPDGRRPHPGRLQLRLLRARAAGPADGRRAGRGPRPGLRRQPGAACGRRTASSAVDVIYRRIDDEFLDPVHFRPDSVIGCAGRAQRRAGRPGDHRQRRGQRGRRRQAALHLGART